MWERISRRYLKLNPTFKLHPPKIYLVLQGGDHELIPEEELYFDNPKMTHLLIESDITPVVKHVNLAH